MANFNDCNVITEGYVPSCATVVPGVNKFWVSSGSTDVVWSYDANGYITGSTGTAPVFYGVELEEGAALASETLELGPYRTTVMNQRVEFIFVGQTERIYANQLLNAGGLMICVETVNGEYILYGADKLLKRESGLADPGVAGDTGSENVVRVVVSGSQTGNFADLLDSTYATGTLLV